MRFQAVATPPNLTVLISDEKSRDEPPPFGNDVVSASSECIAVGTRESLDGPTTLRILDSSEEDVLPALEVFDGQLPVPSGRLAITSVLGEEYLSVNVVPPAIRLKVYVNHSVEPNEIAVVLGGTA